MISSINDLIRQKIDKLVTSNPNCSLVDFMEWYNPKNMKEKDYIIRLIISDFYKVIYFSEDSIPKQYSLNLLENDDITDILICIENNYKLLYRFLNATIKFNRTTLLDKQCIFKKLNFDHKDNDIIKVFNGHILDKISYSDSDELSDLEYLYADYINKSEDINRLLILKNSICLKILKIKEKNKSKYETYLLKFIKNYYKWIKFLLIYDRNLLSDIDFKYLDIIENNDLDDIIGILNYNKDFFTTIVDEYFYFKTMVSDETKEEIENYIKDSFDDDQKKKFKF